MEEEVEDVGGGGRCSHAKGEVDRGYVGLAGLENVRGLRRGSKASRGFGSAPSPSLCVRTASSVLSLAKRHAG